MMVKEIGEKECLEVLSRASVGRLGCALDNQPYVLPVYFAYEPGKVYLFSTVGKKIDWMRANPKVCLEVEEVNQSDWVTVIANGRYEELASPRNDEDIAHARKLLEKRPQWWLNALAERRIQETDMAIKPLFFRILIDSVTGLRGEAESEATTRQTQAKR
jgi:nitroimidazol reductase NimA-like FMN-containing flavoprotein (pyridoxamine 5'-phosphate oxidase superfamily)